MPSNGMTKTAAIREALKNSDSPAEIAKLLNEQGIKVTAGYVSVVKSSDKKKAETKKIRRSPSQSAGHSSPQGLHEANEMLILAVDLVLQVGGEEARHLIDAAAEAVERLRGT